MNDLKTMPDDAMEQMSQVFEWFNANVSKLEKAYQEIGVKFDKISGELEEKNKQLRSSFLQNESMKTQLKSVLESMHSGVIMIDLNGVITLINSSAGHIYGLSVNDCLGKTYEEVMLSYNKPQSLPLLKFLQEAQGQLETVREGEWYWSVSGNLRPIGYTLNLVREPQGEVIGAMEISTDLTQMKQMQNQVQHAKTLAALGEMAATVAHEIRNPLGAIGGFAGLLERDLDSKDERRPLVSKIVQGVSSLNKIVSNLLVFSRPMELSLREMYFLEWLEEILRYGELEIEQSPKNIQLERSFPNQDFKVRLDPEKFQQVLLNLMFNALQSMDQSGTLKFKVELEGQNNLIVSIEDTGKGIPEENLEKIFNPFFTTREQGTGLGLAIVKRIIELHGGKVYVQSGKQGSKFSIHFFNVMV